MLGVARGREVEGSRGGPSRFTTRHQNQPIKSKKKPRKKVRINSKTPHNQTRNLKTPKSQRQNPARHVPIKDSGAKRPVGARAAEEEVPDRVRERLRLRVGREAHRARRAAEATRSVCTRRGGRRFVQGEVGEVVGSLLCRRRGRRRRFVGGQVVVVVYEERGERWEGGEVVWLLVLIVTVSLAMTHE